MAKKKVIGERLTPEQLAEFKDLLLQERAQIQRRLNTSTASLSSNHQAGEEGPDVGSDNFIRETGLAIMGGDTDVLGMIRDSLKKIDDGTYGICQDCGHLIGLGRLRAKPHARYCIDCKSAREQNGGYRNEQ